MRSCEVKQEISITPMHLFTSKAILTGQNKVESVIQPCAKVSDKPSYIETMVATAIQRLKMLPESYYTVTGYLVKP